MTKPMHSIQSAALDAYRAYFNALDPDAELTADDILDNLDTPLTIMPLDDTDATYATLFRLTMNYDACATDILIMNPNDPTYFISIDSDDYRPMT